MGARLRLIPLNSAGSCFCHFGLLFLNPSIDIRRDLGAIRSVPLSCVAYGDNSNRAAVARSSIQVSALIIDDLE